MSTEFECLNQIREKAVGTRCRGLSDDVIKRFLKTDENLSAAIEQAYSRHVDLEDEFPAVFSVPEKDLITGLQQGFLNFYPVESVCPYVPLAARGPWIVTSQGSVIYDTGGYGMLGLGHNPDGILGVLSRPQVMANIMTPSFSQHKFISRVKHSVGVSKGGCPYSDFVCMNSGSGAVSVACRISDIHAKIMTDPGARHAGKKIRFLGLKGGFHGRTGRASQVSSSTLKYYKNLATFRDNTFLIEVAPNDIDALRRAFKEADDQGIYFESMFIEPVQGEGNPGMAVTPEFYAAARELTAANETYLVVDSIQAGLRAHGVLSIVDYPGFEELDAPDMETFSKALNGGQYPLSLLGIQKEPAQIYVPGVYGNTMTANPRALEVGCAVLELMTPELKENIRERGREFVEKLNAAKNGGRFGIAKVQGTGLLVSAELEPSRKVVGYGGVEERMRLLGVQVIHGGTNSLRFTPHFNVTSDEIDLIISVMKEALKE